MTDQAKQTRKKQAPTVKASQPDGKSNSGGKDANKLPKYVMESLYQVQHLLEKKTRERVGLMLKIPIFIKDPLVALDKPLVGIQVITVRLEVGLGDGPTSSRVVVVDFNGDTQTLTGPVVWDENGSWFRTPLANGKLLPVLPRKSEKNYRQFIDEVIQNPYFHQVNAWAVVQRVLEFYEEPWALGRPVPWGFDGNRLIVVPHVGHGENAFYDQHSKSLQFYYFGDQQSPSYTCLSHDIIAHETGHAVLDGIRPMYNQLSSLQTGAFHEFIGDLTAILLALFNEDIRQFVSKTTEGRLGEADILANIAPEFGEEVEGRPYLRTAFNPCTMLDDKIKNSLSPHTISQVMTGAMWDILTGIVAKHLAKNKLGESEGADGMEGDGETDEAGGPPSGSAKPRVTPAKALWWAADRFRRVALQPLDLCPPCDIQFIDYAKAVIRNDILTNPVDELGYRQTMLDVFHRRGLCTCVYKSGKDMPKDCQFQEALLVKKMDFVFHDIEQVSRSRTAAYYFLSDNRKLLHIPLHQDVRVVDLYDANKYGAAVERLPREVVLIYAWQEEVSLANNLQEGLNFGAWNGKTFNLDCGGTLVFDGRGNLLSWFHKPGTEHITSEEEKRILQKEKRTKLEAAMLADLAIGRQRKKALLSYLAANIRRGLVGAAQEESRFSEGARPITAFEDGGAVRFEMEPHLRTSDFDEEEDGWTVNY